MKGTGCWLYRHTTRARRCLHARWEGSSGPAPPARPCADHPSPRRHLGMCSTAQLPPTLECAASLFPHRGPGARGRKISAWHPTKAPRGGSHTTATSWSAGIWQGQASSCSGMCRDNQGSGSMEVAKAAGNLILEWNGNGQSRWKSHLGVATAARRPSSSTVTPGHPPARKRDEVPRNP